MEQLYSTSRRYSCGSTNNLTSESFIYVGLVVDAVLDSNVLRDNTTKLIAEWPILGGKLQNNAWPWTFTCGSHVDFESRAVDLPLSAYLPIGRRHSDKPTVIQSLDLVETDPKFIFNTSCTSDTIFKLRVTVLQNATLLCFGTTHFLTDGTSCFDTIKAFCNLLSNKPIPSFVLPPDTQGIRISDTVNTDGENGENNRGHTRYGDCENYFDYGILKLGKLVCRVMLGKVCKTLGLTERLTERFIQIPRTWVDRARAQAEKELKSSPRDCALNVTRNDIIAACYLKVLYSTHPPTQDAVHFFGPVDYRPFIKPPDPGTYYIHNSFAFLRCKFSVHQLQTEPISNIALIIRQVTVLSKSSSSVRQYLRFSEDHASNIVALNYCGGANPPIVILSPWTTFDFTNLDFSGAGLEANKPSVTFVNPIVTIPPEHAVGPIIITGKDASGDYWIRASNTWAGWERFSQVGGMESLFPSGK